MRIRCIMVVYLEASQQHSISRFREVPACSGETQFWAWVIWACPKFRCSMAMLGFVPHFQTITLHLPIVNWRASKACQSGCSSVVPDLQRKSGNANAIAQASCFVHRLVCKIKTQGRTLAIQNNHSSCNFSGAQF